MSENYGTQERIKKCKQFASIYSYRLWNILLFSHIAKSYDPKDTCVRCLTSRFLILPPCLLVLSNTCHYFNYKRKLTKIQLYKELNNSYFLCYLLSVNKEKANSETNSHTLTMDTLRAHCNKQHTKIRETIHTYLPGCNWRTGHDCFAKLLQDGIWKLFVSLQQLFTLNLSQKQK